MAGPLSPFDHSTLSFDRALEVAVEHRDRGLELRIYLMGGGDFLRAGRISDGDFGHREEFQSAPPQVGRHAFAFNCQGEESARLGWILHRHASPAGRPHRDMKEGWITNLLESLHNALPHRGGFAMA